MRVLIVRVGAMGDVLHALPAVAALRAARPEWEIGWVIEPRWRALLENSEGNSPLLDRVHLAETRVWKREGMSATTLRSMLGLRSGLRAEHYGLCVDLQGSIRSAVVGRLAGARRLAGPAKPREAPARLLYGHHIATGAKHVVEQAAELLGTAAGVALAPARAMLPQDAAAEQWCDDLLRSLAARPFVLLVPQAGWGAKQWPAERFGGLARTLEDAGYTALVNASAERDPVAAEVLRAAGSAAQAVRCSIAELIALTRRARLVVAGDTGPLHLAAALGRPVLALFGPTDPRRTGPYGTRARVFRHETSATDHRRRGATEGGLLQIRTDEVAAAALQVLREDDDAGEREL